MNENHEFNILQRLWFVMIRLVSIVEPSLIPAPPFHRRNSASVR
jgi:hypothetical protein